ncbi:hypothetical protein LEP1GSC082_3988 [Leptospira kirschneri str. H2]|nr:hypothetical protein LEP1GSC082_3988 [Leptospira kirschneri str. H2]
MGLEKVLAAINSCPPECFPDITLKGGSGKGFLKYLEGWNILFARNI